MSDVTTGSTFNPQFFVNPPWWLGRVETKESWQDNIEAGTFTNIASIKGWGHRYKVRVFNWHTGELDKLPPEQMAFCQVIMPVTAGSGHGGASVTPSIEPGSVVFGFFMDGMAGQEGYIVGVVGNSNNNVPKERGVVPPPPPPPPNGPGSLSNTALPPDVDKLSTQQLSRLLNPARTPTREEFDAASKARSEAKAKGLPPQEVERQVLVATAKASRQAATQPPGNCNQGYQQFNNTFSDSNKAPAYVPDNLNIFNVPLQVTEGLHVTTLAWDTQDQDKKVKRPLRNACKKDDSDVQGIAKVLNNLITQADQIKRTAGEVSLAAASIQSQLNNIIQTASSFISSYMTNLLGLILEKLEVEITNLLQKEVIPFLFPSERPTYNNIVSEALEILSCLFKKIISSLVPTFVKLLTDSIEKLVSGPVCAVQQLLSDFLNPILGEITSALSGVLGAIGNIASIVASAFDILSGILKFFLCDEDQSCPGYDEIDLAGPATPGIQVGDFSSEIVKTLAPPGKTPARAVNCEVGPVLCGPPTVNFLGGENSGAIANPIVGSNSSIIGFDIINPGSFTSTPTVSLQDACGNGSGGSFKAIMEPDEENPGKLKLKSIAVESPGTGYLQKPDGSMGGDGFTWKEPDEGYIRTRDGRYRIVGINKPAVLEPGDTYYPPIGPPETVPLQFNKFEVNIEQTVASEEEPIQMTITNLEGESKKYYGFISNNQLSLNTVPNRIARGGSTVVGEDVVEGTIIVLDQSVGIGTTGNLGIGTTGNLGIGTTGNNLGISTDTSGIGTDRKTINLPLLPVKPPNIPVVNDFALTDSSGEGGGRVSYNVVLCVEEIEVLQSGYGYRPEDELIITPSNGVVAKPIINEYGQITGVRVLNSGCGFDDIPEIKTNSSTGFNALLAPILKVKRLSKDEEFDVPKDSKVINVVDCTGCIKCLGGK
jgi:hypothetical protein